MSRENRMTPAMDDGGHAVRSTLANLIPVKYLNHELRHRILSARTCGMLGVVIALW